MPDPDPLPSPGRVPPAASSSAESPANLGVMTPPGAINPGDGRPRGASGSGSGTDSSGGGSAEVRALPHLGEKIDEYRLLESIGAGGMGAVFRAVDLGLDRQVALKILPPEHAVDPEVVRRYYQEGRAAARLDHENIARVYSIGDDGRYHYIAFEYIEGLTIRQRVLREGPLPIAEAVDYTRQIAQALTHAAEREVIHRDIKPSNIIITPGGRAKLVDMGLARSFERRGDADLTQTGMTLGTFDYISPEQARDPRDVDIRGDLYSLGCTLFHMLSGRPPFPEGTVLQKLLQHREETPTDIRRLNPGVPDALAAILVKLLAKDRDRRYQTPEALARDLARVPSRRLATLPAVRVAPAWARHLVWSGPSVVFFLIFAALAWWGDGPIAGPSAAPFAPSVAAPASIVPGTPPTARAEATAVGPADRGGTAPAVVPPPALALAVAPPRELAIGPTDDLARTLADAPARSTILLGERGPFELRGDNLIRLIGKDLTIRAEVGVRPLIRLIRDPVARSVLGSARSADEPIIGTPALLEVRGGRLTLDGLDFLLDPPSLAAATGVLTERRFGGLGPRDLVALAIEDADVIVRRCSFRRIGSANPIGGGTFAGGPAARAVAIRLVATPRTGPGPGVTRGGMADEPTASLVLDASEFDGNQVALLTTGSVDVSVHDGAFGPGPLDQAAIWSDNPDTGAAVPAEFRLDHVSGLIGAGPMFRFGNTAPRLLVRHSVFAPLVGSADALPAATLVSIDQPDRLDWRGADNLFARLAVYLRASGPRSSTLIRSFAAWADDPNTLRESGSSAFEGAVWERLPPTSLNLAFAADSPRSFRLALPRSVPHHPGARWGPLGPLPLPVYLGQPGAVNRTIPVPVEPPRPADRVAVPMPPVPLPVEPANPRPPDSSADAPLGLEPMPMPPVSTPDPDAT